MKEKTMKEVSSPLMTKLFEKSFLKHCSVQSEIHLENWKSSKRFANHKTERDN